MAVKWRDLTWPRKSSEFNLHRLQKIPMGFKMAVRTPNSGIRVSFFSFKRNFLYQLFKFTENNVCIAAWKVSRCGVISGPYFPVLNPNTGKYGPEITRYLDTFHAVFSYLNLLYYHIKKDGSFFLFSRVKNSGYWPKMS